MKTETYVADFETSYENGKSWVWSFGYSKLFTKNVELGGSLDDFMKLVMQGKSKKVYFHNLKFDGKFILCWILEHGYKYSEFPTKLNEYSCLVDNMGNFYSLVVPFEVNKKIQRVTFLDSYKKLPFKLSKIAKDFGMEQQKEEMDYSIVRYEHHKLTPEEESYQKADIVILRNALEIMYNQGMKKSTIGSDALAQHKMMLNAQLNYSFKKIFPKLTLQQDEYLRNAYKGGCCMVHKDIQNKVVPTYSYDVNSMYPSILRYRLMPYGKPKFFEGKYKKDKDYPLYVQHIKCMFYLKENHAPCIQLKHSKIFQSNEWVENSEFITDLYLTNIDLELFLNNYDVIDLEYIDGYKFRGIKGLFTEYIEHFYEIKSTTKNASLKTISKLFLNSLYGKYGTCPTKKSITFKLEDGVLKTDKTIEHTVDLVYLPIAIFTTSYARYYLLSNITKNWEVFNYCDTDSIHTRKPIDNIPLDNKKLGYFKFEYSGRAKYLKQKCYLVKYDEEFIKYDEEGNKIDTKLTCAGLNQDLIDFEIGFDDFYLGREFKKLRAKNVKGGVFLELQTHKIS